MVRRLLMKRHSSRSLISNKKSHLARQYSTIEVDFSYHQQIIPVTIYCSAGASTVTTWLFLGTAQVGRQSSGAAPETGRVRLLLVHLAPIVILARYVVRRAGVRRDAARVGGHTRVLHYEPVRFPLFPSSAA